MILIIGGSYQGKLNYAKERFSLNDSDVHCCIQGQEPDFSKKIINHIEKFVWYCTEKRISAIEYLTEKRDEWKDSVIILEDIFCGVVSTDEKTRFWREESGRLAAWLSSEAESVIRIFCGIDQKLK